MTIITDRSSLAGYMRDWASRADISDAAINLQIELAEVRLNQDLRTTDQIVRAYGFLDADYQTLPDDYLEMTRVTIREGDREWPLEFISNELIFEKYPRNVEDFPQVYTVVGNQLQVRPRPADQYEYEVTYYRTVPPLTADNVTSVILDKYPQLYMYSCLVELSVYLKDDEQKDRWVGLYTDALERVRKQSIRAQRPTPGRVVTPNNRSMSTRSAMHRR